TLPRARTFSVDGELPEVAGVTEAVREYDVDLDGPRAGSRHRKSRPARAFAEDRRPCRSVRRRRHRPGRPSGHGRIWPKGYRERLTGADRDPGPAQPGTVGSAVAPGVGAELSVGRVPAFGSEGGDRRVGP